MNRVGRAFLRRVSIGCALVIGAGAAIAAPPTGGWREFLLPEFETRVEYPAGIFSLHQGKSETGTGERLSTADKRASLTIYARANEGGVTPSSYLRRNLRMPDAAIEYRRVTPSFFAISAEREGMIYYSRCNFSEKQGGAIHCLDLVYPGEEKKEWDAIVTHISLSLRPLGQ